jgi:spore coat polysaccharide biosynthesis protein SpsF
MKIVAIIQARVGSTRLPRKVLADVGGRSMLAQVVRRTQRASLLDSVLVATTSQSVDDEIVEECRGIGVPFFRGEEQDVLDRYFRTARAHQADVIVRITSDCPLIDPEVVDRVIGIFLDEKPDYASNTLDRTYPRGLDTEVMTFPCLHLAWKDAHEAYHREHVTPYIYQNPTLFHLHSVKGKGDYSHYRWTVDTPEDLSFIRAIYARLHNQDTFNCEEVLKVLAHEPALTQINQHIRQKGLGKG